MVTERWNSDRGLTPIVVAIIDDLLGRHVGWAAIARALGGSVEEVRAAYEKAKRENAQPEQDE